MNEKQIKALAKKNAAKAARVPSRQRTYDETLDATRPKDERDTTEVTRLFKEMKKREF